MRVLYTLEIKNAEGLFLPRFGVGTMDRIIDWMSTNISPEMLEKTSEWRIVQYGPLEQEHLTH